MMGPVTTRLFQASKRLKTASEEAEPYELDEMVFPPPSLRDVPGMIETPRRRAAMRQRYPNPKREM
jgi:hypothetical protein